MTDEVTVKDLSFSERLAYANGQFAKNWITQEYVNSRGIMVRLAFMHMVGGNAYDALVLSQIMYWHGKNEETGKPRMSFIYKDNLWIVKSYAEWAKETGINSPETIKNCFERLVKLGLIVKICRRSPMHKQGVTSFVRIDWAGFQAAVSRWIKSEEESVQGYQPETDKGYQPSTDKGYETDSLVQGYQPETFPETTTETTTENTLLVADSATDGVAGAPLSDKGKKLTLAQIRQAQTSEYSASQVFGNEESKATPMPSALIDYLESQDKFQAKLDKKQREKLTTDRKFRDESGETEYKTLAPSKLYETVPLFKEYVAEMIEVTKRINNGLLPFKTLVGMIANYERKTPGMEGWHIWKEQHAKAVTVEAKAPEMTQEELERQVADAALPYYN